MTDQRRDDDEALAERIRRSMAHYRLDRELRSLRRQTSPWRWPMLAGAALAGAAMSLAAVAGLSLLTRAPYQGSEPTPSPSPMGSMRPVSSPSPAAVLDVTEAQAADECLRVDERDVLDRWQATGETKADVVARFAGLPLLILDRREGAVIFVFADDRLVTGCGYVTGQATPESVVRGVRSILGNRSARALFIGSDPMIIDSEGRMLPGGEPEITAIGIASPSVARVAIVLDDGRTLDARLAAGIWLAWWEEPVGGVAIRTYDRAGALIAEVPEEFMLMRVPEEGVEFSLPPDPSAEAP
jgi:hypothetical protein